MNVDFDAPRFTAPILTVRELAHLVGMPIDTARAWTGQRHDRPQLVTRVDSLRRGWPSVPLVGLAEAASLRALRAFLPMKEVPAAVKFIVDQEHIPYPLAHRRLVTDGAAIFVQEHESITRMRDGQAAMAEVIRDYLRPLEYELGDEYPAAYNLPDMPGVQIHPVFNAGRMSFRRNRVPLFAVAGLLLAGEDPRDVALEFDLEHVEVEQVRSRLDWLAEAA